MNYDKTMLVTDVRHAINDRSNNSANIESTSHTHNAQGKTISQSQLKTNNTKCTTNNTQKAHWPPRNKFLHYNSIMYKDH